ncbi:MAG: SCP2 sterol-binding domain-containing protein [Desulfobacterales bacterium]|nr:SCP2 sterol-binding domain-containing protein [Desulfobacterales bacterium]
MSYDIVKAHLNLHAVLQNLEDLVAYDPQTAELAKDWRISIQFSVKGGPQAFVDFRDGTCHVGRGSHPAPSVKLFFTSPAHLNRMMDGKANPIPLKGFTRLGFLAKEFPKATDRLEYFLKPTPELLRDEGYLALNTRMTLNTAAFSVPELAQLDPLAKLSAAHIQDGTVVIKILPEGPAAHVSFAKGRIESGKTDVERPMAKLSLRNMQIANDFFNGRLDLFTAVAMGDVMIKGQTPMLDALGLILDRVPEYLE